MSSINPLSHRTLCRLATTNTPPSAQDAAIIRGTVDDIDCKLAQKTALLAVLQEEIQELERERKFFKPILSPLRRMPLEVMGEIFVQAVGEGHSRQRSLSWLCRVCKGWRDAAVSVPRLWQKTTLNPAAKSLSYEVVSSWVNRAGGLPRTLHIEARDCGPCFKDRVKCMGWGKCPLSKPALGKILRRVSLDKVTIECLTPQCFKCLSSNIAKYSISGPPNPSSWNFIKSISLLWDSWTDERENLDPQSFEFLPNSLTNLQIVLPLITLCPEDVILEVNIPSSLLRRLTSLNLTCNWGSNCAFKILRHCANLQCLILDLQGGDFDWNLPHDAFIEETVEHGLTLPKLRTVQIDCASASSLSNLQLLKIPALSDLSIRFGDDKWMPEDPANARWILDSTVGAILGTLLRGNPDASSTLRSLRITNGYFGNDALFKALEHLSSVEHLTLDNVVVSYDTFARLASRNTLPKLHTLKLLNLHTNPTHFSGLQPFVEKCDIRLEMTRCQSAECGICAC